MSIRNMDADMASNMLNERVHLHRYEDCVVFINRLSHLTVKLVISQISIDVFLARLPYTIGIFEAFYAKIFIMDPENFPMRILQPERLLDKMIVYFSMMNDQTSAIEPVDGLQMLDSFENCIRIISYIQPNLYSRLLYFKYAIDKGLLRLERDLVQYNSQFSIHSSYTSGNYGTGSVVASPHVKTRGGPRVLSVGDAALFVSRASNLASCDSMRAELIQTQQNCEKALSRLVDHINGLKTQKAFKDAAQFFAEQHQAKNKETEAAGKPVKSPKTPKKNQSEYTTKY